MDIKHTNEMNGTLLVELKDGSVYEISRYSSGYSVKPDKGHRNPTREEHNKLVAMYKQSSCFMV
jgi:hypothetical protein